MVYAFSIAAAFFYGLAAVMQHRAAAAAPADESMRLGLLVRLVRKPLWTAGIAADAVAFVLQAAALGRGPLTLVQPLLTVGLLFALVLAALWDRRRPSGREVLAALALIGGLGLLVVFGSPSLGHPTVSFHRWILAGSFVGAGVSVLVLFARRAGSRAKPVLLAVAGALTFAASDALIKSTVSVLGTGGIAEVLDGWYLYALIGVALLGMLLVQSAFQAGRLALSLPALTAVEPIASSSVGVLLFAEHIRTDPAALAAEGLAVCLALFGIWVLGRSPAVVGSPDAIPEATPATPADRGTGAPAGDPTR
jgi:drug/metabolite transporter (DMT)-like permease